MDTNKSPLAKVNGWKKSSGIALAALLVFGAVAGVMAFSPTAAFAAVSIETSSDKFFGPGFVRVLITDTTKDTAGDTIVPTIEARSGSTVLGTDNPTIYAIGTSGAFEFYITTSNAPLSPAAPTHTADPDGSDDPNTTSVVENPLAAGPFVERVNVGATDSVTTSGAVDANGASLTTGINNYGLSTSQALKDGDRIIINYGGQSKEISFSKTTASLDTDRATAGDGDKIVAQLNDPDGNADPTLIDTFTFATPGNILTSSPSITYGAGTATWTESGQNTGIFELAVTVNGSTGDTISAALPAGLTLTATDHEVYETLTGATSPFGSVTPTSSASGASVTLENKDGLLSTTKPVTFANGLSINISDADRNIDTKTEDTFSGRVFVELDPDVFPAPYNVAYTTTGAVVTTTGASTAGQVVMTQTLTFDSDPGTIINSDITLGALTGTGAGVIPGAATSTISGSGTTRTVIITQPFTTTAAVTSVAIGSRTVTVGGIDNILAGLTSSVSAGAPAVSGDGGATAGAGNTQTITVTDDAAGAIRTIPMKETGKNTGIFAPDLSNGKIPINFGTTTGVTSTAITLAPNDVGANPDLTIVYVDPAGEPTGQETFRLQRQLTHTPGTISAPTTVDVTSKFAVTINDPDLDTDFTTAQTYVVNFPGTNVATATNTAPVTFANGVAELSIEKDNANFGLPTGGLSLSFTETGPNTGIFTATNVDMGVITRLISPEDGDQILFVYNDLMENPDDDNDTTINIGKAEETIDVDRTTIPIPMPLLTPSSPHPAIPADTVKFNLSVVDPNANQNPSSTETVSISGTDIAVEDVNGGSSLTAGMLSLPSSITLTETGVSTGVFTKEITLQAGTTAPNILNVNAANGGKIKFSYKGETTSVVLKSFDLSISTDKVNVKNGDTLAVTLTDADRNLDPNRIDQIQFNIQGVDDDLAIVPLTADETGLNTGVFSKNVVVGTDFKITDTSGSSVISSTQIEIKARDRIASDSSQGTVRERTINIGTATATIQVEPENPGPGTKVNVKIFDDDLNKTPTGTDIISDSVGILKITTDRSGIGTHNLGAKETGPSTGIFEHKITFTALPNDSATPSINLNGNDESTVTVLPGDIVSIRYTDQTNASGREVTVSKTFKIVSVDPEFVANKEAVDVNDSFELTIADSDANLDADVVDTITIRTTSNSDAVGFETTAVETGPNTGIFKVLLQTTDSVEAGSVTVNVGDNVTVKYEDKYPSDYADRVDTVLNPKKDFFFNIVVGQAITTGIEATTPSKPVLKDFSGRVISEITVGSQVVISTDITNNNSVSLPIVALVEVRDSEDRTVYLQWQTGTLNPDGTSNMGLSWTPDVPDDYTVRVFVVSNLQSPQALSPISQATYTVS